MTFTEISETEQIATALAGNTAAFNALVEPYRQQLLVHCYRMSGSLDDAEDIVQETFLRAWKKLDSFQGQGSFRNWLYTIATRQWIDEVRKRKKQVLLPLNGSPTDPNSPLRPPTTPANWLDPLPTSWLTGSDPSAEFSTELRESISYAFMVALQELNARQRIVLILRSVFNWSAIEVAEVLDLTVASVNNLLYRARKNLAVAQYEEGPTPKQNLDHFLKAWEMGDVSALIDLLQEKATFAMPPLGVWYSGKAAIETALANFVFRADVRWKLLPTSANGRSAFAIYQQAQTDQPYQPFGLILPIFNAEAGKIREIVAFLSPNLIHRFGLPPTIPA